MIVWAQSGEEGDRHDHAGEDGHGDARHVRRTLSGDGPHHRDVDQGRERAAYEQRAHHGEDEGRAGGGEDAGKSIPKKTRASVNRGAARSRVGAVR